MNSQTLLLCLVHFGDWYVFLKVASGDTAKNLGQYGTFSVSSRSFSAFPDIPRSFSTVLLPHKVEVAIGSGITSWLGWVR